MPLGREHELRPSNPPFGTVTSGGQNNRITASACASEALLDLPPPCVIDGESHSESGKQLLGKYMVSVLSVYVYSKSANALERMGFLSQKDIRRALDMGKFWPAFPQED